MRYVKDFYLKKILLRINHNFLAVFYFADKFMINVLEKSN